MNVSVTDALALSFGIQQSWLAGNMTRFQMVDEFLEGTVGDQGYEEQIDSFLPRLKILTFSSKSGVEVIQPQSRRELVTALKRSTWIPLITGQGVLRSDPAASSSNASDPSCLVSEAEEEEEDVFYLDGGFSRVLHPTCEFDLFVPLTWINMLYTLNPAMTPSQVEEMWDAGRNFDHPLLTSQ